MSKPDINELLRQSVEAVKRMTPEEYDEMIRLQRESWVRGMGPCEHGVRDFETCAECRQQG